MPTPQPPNAAQTVAVFGARGTGKTAWIKQRIRREAPPRLLVWDFKNDPTLEDMGRPVATLPAMFAAMKAPRFQLRYKVNHATDIKLQFEYFCRGAYEAGCLLMFVDELPEVTKAGSAPPAWRRCVNVGRDYRDSQGARKWLSIIGAGQRAAECDKSFISNADVIHTGRANHLDDAIQIARTLGCKPTDIVNLPNLHWIEKDAAKTTFERGILKFSKR